MAVEQPLPEGAPRIELGPLTEPELRSSGAVKLLYAELVALRSTHQGALADLQTERQRNEALTFRAHTSEIDCRVLRERIGYSGYRELIVRLIELVILGLLAFAIDSARTGHWEELAGCLLMALILVATIILIQKGHEAKELK